MTDDTSDQGPWWPNNTMVKDGIGVALAVEHGGGRTATLTAITSETKIAFTFPDNGYHSCSIIPLSAVIGFALDMGFARLFADDNGEPLFRGENPPDDAA
jgi:hypothetical protein